MDLIDVLLPPGWINLVMVAAGLIVFGVCNLLGNVLLQLYGLGVPAWLMALFAVAIALGVVRWLHNRPSLTSLGGLTRGVRRAGRGFVRKGLGERGLRTPPEVRSQAWCSVPRSPQFSISLRVFYRAFSSHLGGGARRSARRSPCKSIHRQGLSLRPAWVHRLAVRCPNAVG